MPPVNPTRLVAALGLAALAACATTSPNLPMPMSVLPPGPPPAEFKALGEVQWVNLDRSNPARRVAFDAWRVMGPPMNLLRGPDGRWVGTFHGLDTALTPGPGKLTGAGVDLTIVRQPNGSVLVTGYFADVPVRIDMTPDRLKGSAGPNGFDLSWMGPGMYNSYAGLLQLTGAAGQLADPVLPQAVLALLAVLLP
jgi:hypothetical protein